MFPFSYFKRKRRQKYRAQPFPEAWKKELRDKVAIYDVLPEEEKRIAEGHIQVLLAEKNFEGCGGLELTDAMRLVITGQAAILILYRDVDYFPKLKSILVYPGAFVSRNTDYRDSGVVEERRIARAGESWGLGTLVFAWDAVLRQANTLDGHNVVLHEFAHQLDQEDGASDGFPAVTIDPGLRKRWGEVFMKEYLELREDVERGRRTIIDDYGAQSPAEFFAVVTEVFFERPRVFRKRHPELYEVLGSYYDQDPAA